ncbi:MAG: RpiB/LacA/LacB family sugar-phosphate isomerase [Lachnospiraceae bacterium]
MKIAIGCDPNAMNMKKELMEFVSELGHDCEDFGSEDSVYANVAIKVARAVAEGSCDRGILICGTGIGISIAANKVKGAYAALVTDIYQAQRAQLSNNANIIALGAQVTGISSAKCLVKEYLSQIYDPDGRSASKIKKICEYEVEG